MTTIVQDGRTPNPSLLGSVTYLTMNLVVGIASFTAMVTLLSVGLGTMVVWVGLPVLAVAILACRGGAVLERARVHRMLGGYIASPYRPLPESGRWKARVTDAATWKDLTYWILMLPVGIAEFTTMVATWSTSLGMLFLPVYFRYLPEGEWRVFDWDSPWLVVDSTWEAIPVAVLGLGLLGVTIHLTKAMASAHVRFARALLGPTVGTVRAHGALRPVSV